MRFRLPPGVTLPHTALHVERDARSRYEFPDDAFTVGGRLLEVDLDAAQRITSAMNAARDAGQVHGERALEKGQEEFLEVLTSDPGDLSALVEAFHATHRQRFSYANPGDPVEIVTLRAIATGLLDKPEPGDPPPADRPARKGTRRVFGLRDEVLKAMVRNAEEITRVVGAGTGVA